MSNFHLIRRFELLQALEFPKKFFDKLPDLGPKIHQSLEIITVGSSGGGTTLNVTRGEDGTSAVAHSAGATVRHIISGRDFNEFSAHIGSSGTPTTAGVHGVTGNVVGDTDSQTLTNKKLTSPEILGSGILS